MGRVRILKDGETDIESADIWRFALHSDYPNIKIKFSGSANFTMLTGEWDAFYTIPHNLGYVPQVFGWLERSGKIYPCNLFTGITDVLYGPDPDFDQCTVFAYCFADATNVYIGAYNKFPVDAGAYANYAFTAHWRIAVDEF